MNIEINNFMGIGDWGLGIGQIPNPQTLKISKFNQITPLIIYINTNYL